MLFLFTASIGFVQSLMEPLIINKNGVLSVDKPISKIEPKNPENIRKVISVGQGAIKDGKTKVEAVTIVSALLSTYSGALDAVTNLQGINSSMRLFGLPRIISLNTSINLQRLLKTEIILILIQKKDKRSTIKKPGLSRALINF